MKKHILLLIFMLTAAVSFAQQVKIKGVVTSATGPVMSASVYEKDVAGSGTTTNGQGQFELTIRGKGILMIESVTYLSQEIRLDGRTEITVTLQPDIKGLEDVVVLAYGKKKKITNTGAVGAITGNEIRETPVASLQNALAGRLPGFTTQQRSGQPGSDGATYLIRGLSSMTSNGAPLILVDDIEYGGSLSEIDPDQVESLTILKDASTTAVFGIKGANGVIVITTRRGKTGRPQITFRSEAAGQRPTFLPSYLNSYESARLRNQALVSDGLPVQWTDADLEAFKNGTDPYGHPNVDWQKELMRPFSMQTYNTLNISGGTEKAKYFVTTGYLWQNGMVKDFTSEKNLNSNYYYKRYNFRSNLDFNVTKTTSLSVDLAGNFAERNEPNIGGRNNRNNVFFEISDYNQLPPFAYQPYNPDGSYGSNSSVGSYSNNIIGRLALGGYNRSYDNTLFANFKANQKLDFITPGLSVRGTVAYSAQFRFWRSMTRTEFPSYKYMESTDTYVPYNPNVYRIEKLNLGYFADGPNSIKKFNWQAALNYDRTFGKHHVYGLALINQFSDNAGDATPVHFRGLSFRAGYDYKQKYLLEVNGGYNGTSKFSSKKRYQLFPAVSAGWNVAEEAFFKELVPFVDLFKIRASIGLVGTDNVGNFGYVYLQTFNRSGSYSIGDVSTTVSGIVEGTLGTDVTWEKERQPNIGVDLKMFNGKLGITADYFERYRYDILITRGSVSNMLGVGLPPVNLGKVQNNGYEVDITFADKISKVNYSVRANISVAKNKILYQDEAQPAFPWLSRTGGSLGRIAGYTFVGYYQDDNDVLNSARPAGITPKPGDLKYADLNKDNVIDVNDMSVLPQPNLPNTILGFTGTIGYKGINLSFTFQSALNFANRKVAEAINPFSNNLRDVHANAWTPDNKENPGFPRLSTVAGISNPLTYPSDYWFRRTDYLRLKTVQLSYSVPKAWAGKLSLNGIRVYASGYNLLTWMLKDKNIYEVDPETPSGTEGGEYPVQKVINFGLQISF